MPKKPTEEKNILVTTIPLKVEKWQADKLDKRFDIAKTIYNSMLHKKLAIYKRYINSPEYKQDQETIKNLFAEYEAKNPGNKEKAKKDAKKDPIYKEIYMIKRQNQLKDLGFTEFGFIGDSIRFAKHFPAISSNIAQLSIGKPLWSAFEKYIYGEGEKISFKNDAHPINSLASNGKSGIRMKEDNDGNPCIIMKSGNHKNDLYLYFNENGIDEHTRGILLGDIKIVRVLRRLEKTKWHYYAQITAENPVIIANKKHIYGRGKVGIFIDNHTGELIAVSKDRTYHADLVLDSAKIHEEKAKLQVELDKIKRANNPDNFNENGTIKKGIVGEDGRKHRLKWNVSNTQKRLNREIRELDRKLRIRKEINRNVIVHELLSMGDEFYIKKSKRKIEKRKFDQEKPENNPSNSKLHAEKEQRKLFQSIGASALITKLNNALKKDKKEPVHEIVIPKTHYFYHHEDGNFYSDRYRNDVLFDEGYVNVGGKHIPRGEYFAFINQYFIEDTQEYDKQQISKNIFEFDFYKLA